MRVTDFILHLPVGVFIPHQLHFPRPLVIAMEGGIDRSAVIDLNAVHGPLNQLYLIGFLKKLRVKDGDEKYIRLFFKSQRIEIGRLV